MAKNCMIRRNKKVNTKLQRRAKQRDALRESVNNPELDFEEKMKLYKKWQKDKIFSSRGQRRCEITGRVNGVWRKFGMCRHFIRLIGMEHCEIPGLVKSSW